MGIRNFALSGLSALVLCGCSINLAKPSGIENSNSTQGPSFFTDFSILFNGNKILPSQELEQEYNSAIDLAKYPKEQCSGKIQIDVAIQQGQESSPWAIPLAFIPIWPLQPVDETWSYFFSSEFICNKTIVKKINFTESQKIRATFYGKLRSDLVNEASREMHSKLIHRLAFELQENRPADLNSAQDF